MPRWGCFLLACVSAGCQPSAPNPEPSPVSSARASLHEPDAGASGSQPSQASVSCGFGQGADPKQIAEAQGRCDRGDLAGCHALGLALLSDASKVENNRRAAEAFRKACQGNYPAGCNGLGVMVRDGLGVPRDQAEARRLFERACREGISTGCEHLADLDAQTRP